MEPSATSTTTHQHNPWLTVSAALMGVIVGYGVASVHVSSLVGSKDLAAQVARPDAPAVPAAPTPPPAAPAADPPEVTDTDHILGNPDAPITVIEYSDFQCPFCSRVLPTMKQLRADYGDKVNIVYRHFPLSFHPQAQKSAEASECVAELGGNDAFWSYHDKLFENQATLGPDLFVKLAKDLGVDEAQFKACLDGGKYAKLVQDQMSGGSAAGVQGTPGSFVVNNDTGEAQSISGAVPVESFKAVIDGMLQ
jgi:protein-disulfide isomerase